MSGELSAYEKMLRDGSAFKKIDMQRIQNQQYAEAGSGVDMPLGDPAPITEDSQLIDDSKNGSQLVDDHTDWSAVDEAMQKRMDSLRSKIDSKVEKKRQAKESDEINKLKRRIKQLEEAMMLIMETHEKLLGD